MWSKAGNTSVRFPGGMYFEISSMQGRSLTWPSASMICMRLLPFTIDCDGYNKGASGLSMIAWFQDLMRGTEA
jgi:hypothetical protein